MYKTIEKDFTESESFKIKLMIIYKDLRYYMKMNRKVPKKCNL